MGKDQSDDLQAVTVRPVSWPIGMMVFGAIVGAAAMFFWVVWMIQGMGAAGGGDGLDGIECCLPVALAMGAVGGAGLMAILNWLIWGFRC